MTEDHPTLSTAAEYEAIRDRNREAVAAAVETLRERFGTLPVRAYAVENDPEFYAHGRDRIAAGFYGGGGTWTVDDRGRVLVVRHAGEDAWGVPAGGVEAADESLVETARRETFEETGVRVEVTGVRRVDRKTFVHREARDRRLELVEAWFDARPVDDGEVRLDPSRWEPTEEIAAARWATERPAALHDGLGEFADDHDWPGD